MEALRTLEDPEAISREVRELQQQWRLAADVPRAQARPAVAALQDGARRSVGPLRRRISPPRPRARAQNLAQEDRSLRKRRSAGRLDELDPDRRRNQTDAGRMEDDRPRVTRTREGGLGPVPRGLRSLLHAAPGRPRRAQSDCGPRTSRRKRRSGAGGSARRVDRLGTVVGGTEAPAGRVEDHRSREEEPVRCDLAALPRSVRSLFRTLRAAATTSRVPSGSPPAKRSVPSSKRSDRSNTRNRPPISSRSVRALRARMQQEIAAARCRSRTGPRARRAFCGGVRRAARALARSVRATRTSTLRRTANGWNRWCWRVEELATSRWSGGRRRGRCGAVADDSPRRRCSRKRSRPTRSAEKSTMTAGGAPRWKTSGRRRTAGRASGWSQTRSVVRLTDRFQRAIRRISEGAGRKGGRVEPGRRAGNVGKGSRNRNDRMGREARRGQEDPEGREDPEGGKPGRVEGVRPGR